MYKFIKEWNKKDREVVINDNSVDILESGMIVFKLYTKGYYTRLVVVGNSYKIGGIGLGMLELLNETMKELESERDV